MNAVEIEEAISQLAKQPFDAANFPYAFLEAFGNKETTIKRLRAGATNKSDLGGLLQTGSIHIATCNVGQVTQTFRTLKESPATIKAKAKFIEALFRAMNTKHEDRAHLPRWALSFPHVNGGLFSGNMDVPRFSRIARSYLLHIGGLDWTKINPDIFGSMIQAVTEDEKRGALGMHYTSVPNILKVPNPLFLDDLRAKLQEASDNPRALLNLRKRMAKIRVFDPACGSGNFSLSPTSRCVRWKRRSIDGVARLTFAAKSRTA